MGLCASGLAKTKKLADERGVAVKTELVNLNNAVWTKNQWDGIICVFGHFPLELRQKTLQGVKESIKPGGYFVTEVYSQYQLPYKSGGPQDVALLYHPEEFLQTFHDWRIVHFFYGGSCTS